VKAIAFLALCFLLGAWCGYCTTHPRLVNLTGFNLLWTCTLALAVWQWLYLPDHRLQ
jgi:hypothetical protein